MFFIQINLNAVDQLSRREAAALIGENHHVRKSRLTLQ